MLTAKPYRLKPDLRQHISSLTAWFKQIVLMEKRWMTVILS